MKDRFKLQGSREKTKTKEPETWNLETGPYLYQL
jgi:hypothetical protein